MKAKVFNHNIMREVGISVDTFGGYVILTGAVENEKQRESTTAIVKSVYEVRKVEPHGLKPMAPPHASKGGTLRSIPHYAPNELRGVPTSYSSTVLKPVALCEGG